MVLVTDVLVPARFLALLGHFFAALLAMYAVKDSVVVALPYNYTTVQMEQSIDSARASIWVTYSCLFINAVCFFLGFNTFSIAHGLFRKRR